VRAPIRVVRHIRGVLELVGRHTGPVEVPFVGKRRALDGFVGGQRRRDGGRAQDGVAAQVAVATFAKNAESAPR